MAGEQRNSYAALTGLMADNLEPNAPSKKNAYSTFVALSAANIATNQPLQTTAPLCARPDAAPHAGGRFLCERQACPSPHLQQPLSAPDCHQSRQAHSRRKQRLQKRGIQENRLHRRPQQQRRHHRLVPIPLSRARLRLQNRPGTGRGRAGRLPHHQRVCLRHRRQFRCRGPACQPEASQTTRKIG